MVKSNMETGTRFLEITNAYFQSMIGQKFMDVKAIRKLSITVMKKDNR